MGMIINIDEALRLHADYNILKEPLHKMMKDMQEAWEKDNPLDMIYVRGTLDSFQETYTSSIGFEHAFAETSDYAVGPIFNTENGFAATYTSRTFQGRFIISQQVLEDGQAGKVKDTATQFLKRWHGDVVEYGVKALEGAFGLPAYFDSGDGNGKSRIELRSADTNDGSTNNPSAVKLPLFSNKHTIVAREGNVYNFNGVATMDGKDSSLNISNAQSNLFYVKTYDDTDGSGLSIGNGDPGQISKLADVINQVITYMENLKDDNGKITGVLGEKYIVAGNDPHLKAALNAAISADVFHQGEVAFPNVAKDRAVVKTSPYFLQIPQLAGGQGFFIVDKAYNAENHGLELTERIAMTLDAFLHKEAPRGILYEGRQRFDVNVATWRGIAYVRLGTPGETNTGWDAAANYTQITAVSTIVKPVTVVGTVVTES